jgi:DNA repair protein RadC
LPIRSVSVEGRRYTIKQLPAELRPRERLLEAGPAALSDAELLGILLGIGNREKTAVELASEVISTHGDLFGLHNITVCVPIYEDNRSDVPSRPGRR